MADREPLRFFCRECGADVSTFVPFADNDDEVCMICTYILSFDDPVEREKVRKLMRRVEL